MAAKAKAPFYPTRTKSKSAEEQQKRQKQLMFSDFSPKKSPAKPPTSPDPDSPIITATKKSPRKTNVFDGVGGSSILIDDDDDVVDEIEDMVPRIARFQFSRMEVEDTGGATSMKREEDRFSFSFLFLRSVFGFGFVFFD